MTDVQAVLQVISEAKELRPVVEAAINEFKEFYLPQLEQASDYCFTKGTDARIAAFKKFRDQLGVSNDQATALTINLFDMFKNTGVKQQ